MNNITRDAELLSKLLDIPANMVFKRRSELSKFCLKELENSVVVPSGYSFSKYYRIPRRGDYFLDLEILAKDHRLIVYRSKNTGDSPKIIMRCSRRNGDLKFCLETCVDKDNYYCYLGEDKVRLLRPYIDSTSRTALITSDGRLILAHVEELVNLNDKLPHKNRLNKWFNLSDTDKKNISDLEGDIFGVN